MKKRLISLCCFVTVVTGCSSSTNGKYKLGNLVCENISNLTSIGYVSQNNATDNKLFRKEAIRGYVDGGDSYFYLAGMINDEVQGLSFGNIDSFDIPICEYYDLGDFVGFSVVETDYDGTHFLRTRYGYGGSFDGEYLLSKKTGKIYSLKNIHIGDNTSALSISFAGEKAIYGSYLFSVDDQGVANWSPAVIKEKDNQLVIEKSDMLSFLGELHETINFDNYGNILCGNTIYSYEQKKLEIDFDTSVIYYYSSYFGIIFTYYDESFWVLKDSMFEKYDNAIFGYKFPIPDEDFTHSRSHYYYYKDLDGKIRVGYDENQLFFPDSIYSVNDDGTLDGTSWVAVNDEFDLNRQYDLLSNYIYQFQNIIYIYGYWYEILDAYTYVFRNDIKYDCFPYGFNFDMSVFRDQYVYYVDNHNLIKCDFINKVNTQVDTQGYQITSISKDSIGNIKVVGYDSSFNAFSGYLDENDSVTFAPIYNNYGYDVIYMNPIN